MEFNETDKIELLKNSSPLNYFPKDKILRIGVYRNRELICSKYAIDESEIKGIIDKIKDKNSARLRIEKMREEINSLKAPVSEWLSKLKEQSRLFTQIGSLRFPSEYFQGEKLAEIVACIVDYLKFPDLPPDGLGNGCEIVVFDLTKHIPLDLSASLSGIVKITPPFIGDGEPPPENMKIPKPHSLSPVDIEGHLQILRSSLKSLQVTMKSGKFRQFGAKLNQAQNAAWSIVHLAQLIENHSVSTFGNERLAYLKMLETQSNLKEIAAECWRLFINPVKTFSNDLPETYKRYPRINMNLNNMAFWILRSLRDRISIIERMIKREVGRSTDYETELIIAISADTFDSNSGWWRMHFPSIGNSSYKGQRQKFIEVVLKAKNKKLKRISLKNRLKQSKIPSEVLDNIGVNLR